MWAWRKVASVVRMAAPVGVTISPVGGQPGGGVTVGARAMAKRAAVAGEGTGRTPWALLTKPEPVGSGEQ